MQEKRLSQRHVMAPFRDKYAPTSKQYVATEPKTRAL